MGIQPPPSQAQALLRVIVEAIHSGEVQEGRPETFLTYSDVLERLGHDKPWPISGEKLSNWGLKALNRWTREHAELPKVASLVVNKESHRPSPEFFVVHNRKVDGAKEVEWWLSEAKKSMEFDWSPFIVGGQGGGTALESRMREPAGSYGGASLFENIITVEPGKRGGRPTIRGMRITVGDILGWLAAGMDEAAIIRDYPELTREDIRAALAYAAERENGRTGRKQQGPSKLALAAAAGKFELPKPHPSDARLTYLLERYRRHRS
jgi:uncharacterized protein (DUF433 family)